MSDPTLAIETAFPSISLALQIDGDVLLPRIDTSARRASALHAALADLLEQAELPASRIESVLVDIGPGSYTGLRVGLAMVRSLAELVPIEIRTLYSTDQIAWCARPPDGAEFLVCLDARRSQWYCARYRYRAEGLMRLDGPRCVTVAELRASAAATGGVFSVSDTPPLDGPITHVGIPQARSLFELASLSQPDSEPSPVYLMPPV